MLRRSPVLLGTLVAYPLVIAAARRTRRRVRQRRSRASRWSTRPAFRHHHARRRDVRRRRHDPSRQRERQARPPSRDEARARAAERRGGRDHHGSPGLPRATCAGCSAAPGSGRRRAQGRSARASPSRFRRSSIRSTVSSSRRSSAPTSATSTCSSTARRSASSAAISGSSASTAPRELLDELPPSPKRDRVLDFVHVARLALYETGAAMRATANPIELEQVPEHGRTWALSAQVQSYALAVTIAFLALLLAASALASERDENVIGRLARGLVELRPARLGEGGAGGGRRARARDRDRARVRHRDRGGRDRRRRALGAAAAPVRGRAPCGREPRRAWHLIGGLAREARTASLVALLVVPADRLPRPRPARGRAGGRLDQRGLSFLARGHVLPGRALRFRPVDDGRTEALWLIGLGAGTALAAVPPRRLLVWEVLGIGVTFLARARPAKRSPGRSSSASTTAWPRLRGGPRRCDVWSLFRGHGVLRAAEQQAMVNYRVRDLNALLAQLRARAPTSTTRSRRTRTALRFGHRSDGNRFELWEPRA